MARRKKKGKIAVIIILSVLILAAAGVSIFVFNTPVYVGDVEKTGMTNPLTGEQVETLPARPLWYRQTMWERQDRSLEYQRRI